MTSENDHSVNCAWLQKFIHYAMVRLKMTGSAKSAPVCVFKLITQEIAGWWGPYATSAIQQSKLYQDILIGYDKLTNTQHWFIGTKEVCKNFYVRARGKPRTSVEKCQREFVNSRESYLHAVDRHCNKIQLEEERRWPEA